MRAPLPHANCYALPATPDLLAGEYPGAADRAAAIARLRAFRAAGVGCFIDLTEEGELEPYAPLFGEVWPADAPPLHRRLPIRDVSVPSEPERMHAILDAIDAALAAGHRVYVHCWGGVGRTGTVIGAHLVRHGLAPDDALALVQRAFGTTAKGTDSGRRSPETEAQAQYVHEWPAAERAPSRAERFRGALLGLAAGDALGTTLEFQAPGTFTPITTIVGGGPFRLHPGQWTDDTSMALCLAESLVERGGFDADDQMRRYLRWWRTGYRSSTGVCFDIGNTVSSALRRYEQTADPIAGSTDPMAAGNGSLMRLAPAVLYWVDAPREAVAMAAASSRTTHGARAAVDACRWFAALLLGALRGVHKSELLDPGYVDRVGFFRDDPLDPAVLAVARGTFRAKAPPAIRGTGYVVDSLEAALWAFDRSDDFRSGALAAVNLGDDADTTGAVYGQLAGAYYGVEGIPAEWRAVLAMREEIECLADRLGCHGATRATDAPAAPHP